MARSPDITLVNYGRWYYNHASTYMPIHVRENTGKPDYPDRHGGETITIRPATDAEHEAMCVIFDAATDSLRDEGFVFGFGNFDPKDPPKGVAKAVRELKARARAEAQEYART